MNHETPTARENDSAPPASKPAADAGQAKPQTPGTGKPKTPPDRLEDEICEVVEELMQGTNDPGMYCKLVEVGIDHDPRQFRKCLKQTTDLGPTRISEVISILRAPATASEFAAGRISVREALTSARNQLQVNGMGGSQRKKAARLSELEAMAELVKTRQRLKLQLTLHLNRLLRQQGALAPWTVQVGAYQLSFQPPPDPAPITVS